MKINAKVNQRLERLEQVICVEQVPIHLQLLRLTLPKLSDVDLTILKLVFHRGSPISAQTEEERAILGRLCRGMESAQQTWPLRTVTDNA